MFNKKSLVASAETNPYPGYTKALLTVGSEDIQHTTGNHESGTVWHRYTYYGFSSRSFKIAYGVNTKIFGSLLPTAGYEYLFAQRAAEQYQSDAYYLDTTRPFYLDGKLYSTHENAKTLFDYLSTREGSVIEVYLKNA